jgi:hypothetical protein
MSYRVVSVTERALTTTVDNIEHIESQSLYGVAVVKVFLQPNANIRQGIAQITAISQTQLKQLPAGTTPPLILAYSASSVPVVQLALSGQNLSEQELNDLWPEFYSDAAHHSTRSVCAISVRRKTTSGAGGSEYDSVAVKGAIRAGCSQMRSAYRI